MSAALPAADELPRAAGSLAGWAAARIFIAFAFAYFFSALLRAVTATLAPVFSHELGLGAAQLGLLAGAYFLGFSATQLPLGQALDRVGPKRVLLPLLAVAVAGCIAFALGRSFTQLMLARLLIGFGVSACLMAPLTCYRHRFDAALQLRSNSWMLMTGSLGMLASTLPVQWLLPVLGWRGLFVAVAGLLVLAMVAVAWVVPADGTGPAGCGAASASGPVADQGYRGVFAHPAFVQMAPLGFFVYGGMVAMQSLWIGPWLTEVAGLSGSAAARGLFLVNSSMLVAFLAWGTLMPRLVRAGWSGERVIGAAWWPGVLVLLGIVAAGPSSGAAMWALWCVCTSALSLSQPAVAQAFPAAMAGRALSAFNLVIFAGVFGLQWGIGLVIDLLRAQGWSVASAYRAAFAMFLVACVGSSLWMRLKRSAPSTGVPSRISATGGG